jgi:PAS domain S-box-containing protein
MSSRPDIEYHQARVLIVDDERHNRELLEVMLKPDGFILVTAGSGEEALAIVAQQTPDLVLLDIMMPGMDGYQVATTLKGDLATRNIPIIMVTALDDRKAKLLGLTAGAEDFLTKPVDRAELCARVRNLLRMKAYGDYYDKYSQMLEGVVAARLADLAERTKQAAVLSEQAALLDLAQDAIVVRDMHGRILFWSRGAEALYGWLSHEAVGRDSYELLKTEFSEPSGHIDATLLRQGRWEGEVTHHRRDGTRVIVASRWALQRDGEGAPVRVLSINTNVTDRKETDNRLLSLTERLSISTAVAKVGVWEWDLVTNTLNWDATMFEIYGLPHVDPMPYERWAAAVCPEELPAVEAALQRVIAEKGQGASEYHILLPDGSRRFVSAIERVVIDERGRVSRLIGVNMDVTERKRMEATLEQTGKDQMRFKDEFLSHVSHELRSPLTAIKQFTSILLGGLAGELNKEQREYQQIVLKNIGQLQSMIDDLVEVTRLETGKITLDRQSMSVSDAATDSVNTLQGTALAKGLTVSSAVPADLPAAYADPTRLRQILIILLENAIKFTPAGGTVQIRAQVMPDDQRFLLLEVSDSGCGISPETAERLFERLYQVPEPILASRKGLGLGLFIGKELVTRQGGRIWVKSQPQVGSTFSFTVPVFSLNELIAPLLKDDKWPAESVALVVTECTWLDPWPSHESREEWYHDARNLLRRCLRPDQDVLLPNMGGGLDGERFIVAAFADDRGAAVLANRIREQFERLPRLNSGLLLSVSYSMLQPARRDADAPVESIVTSMATHLEGSIKSRNDAKDTYHE